MVDALQCASRMLDLTRPKVMGILNVTPDSFSDGGLFVSAETALSHARRMSAEGASIIDVGGESTRPGATPVSEQEELDRVIPVIEAIEASLDVVVSVDTSKTGVMQAAVDAGAGMINDVKALQSEGAIDVASKAGVPVCLMHMQGDPQTMQSSPDYHSIVDEVTTFLENRIQVCLANGIKNGNIVIDPGFGFGKTPAHNYSILKHFKKFTGMGFPVLAGLSRKSMIAAIIDRAPGQRTAASVALATIAAMSGARILRVHDVQATIDALAMCHSVLTAK